MLFETIFEAPQTVCVCTLRAAFHINPDFHQRFPPISPLAQSWPSE
jgi:hypothetical protein